MIKYIYAVIGVFCAVFAALFKLRGDKIEKQADDIDNLKTAVKEAVSNVEQYKKSNEILNEPSDLDAAVNRMRERANNNNKG